MFEIQDAYIDELIYENPFNRVKPPKVTNTGLRDSYIFLNQFGKSFMFGKSMYEDKWKPLLKRCGLDYRAIYQIRHLFEPIMLQVAWVSYMLGHTDMHTTLTKYARYISRAKKKRATFMDNVNLKAI